MGTPSLCADFRSKGLPSALEARTKPIQYRFLVNIFHLLPSSPTKHNAIQCAFMIFELRTFWAHKRQSIETKHHEVDPLAK